MVATQGPALDAAEWLSLGFARYFAWRAAENSALYLAEVGALRVYAIGAPARAPP